LLNSCFIANRGYKSFKYRLKVSVKRDYLMKARNYGPVKGQAYTRKEYVKGFPPPKIVKFTMGDIKGTWDYEARLVSIQRKQIRHMALEAARVATNRVLMEKLINDYLMTVLPYPHVILRENKMIFGAHADRLQQGMRRSFGRTVGTAARIEPGQTIMTVKVKAAGLEAAKESLKRGTAKLPLTCRIIVEKIKPEVESKDDATKVDASE
jgi:large subunit ribosomal protein L10e